VDTWEDVASVHLVTWSYWYWYMVICELIHATYWYYDVYTIRGALVYIFLIGIISRC